MLKSALYSSRPMRRSRASVSASGVRCASGTGSLWWPGDLRCLAAMFASCDARDWRPHCPLNRASVNATSSAAGICRVAAIRSSIPKEG